MEQIARLTNKTGVVEIDISSEGSASISAGSVAGRVTKIMLFF